MFTLHLVEIHPSGEAVRYGLNMKENRRWTYLHDRFTTIEEARAQRDTLQAILEEMGR